jgi:DNA-directed RNA polymerase subunit L
MNINPINSTTSENMETYQVTITIKSEIHPRKWIAETISEVLNHGEDIIDYEITPVQLQPEKV